MFAEEGSAVGEAAMDAVAYAEEHLDEPALLTVCVVLTVEDAEGDVHVVTHVWAR